MHKIYSVRSPPHSHFLSGILMQSYLQSYLSFKGSVMLLSVIEWLFIGTVCLFLWFSYKGARKRKPLPPFSSATYSNNLSAPSKQKTLFQHERNRKLFNEFKEGMFGCTPFGAVYQSRAPFWNPFIMVSDYTLARIVLNGDSRQNVKEGEKAAIVKALNFLDRNENNLVTHLTADDDREKARKTIAHAFSTSNLMKTWPHVKAVLDDQFASFRIAHNEGTVLDMKDIIVLLFMRTLSRGAFGIEFTDNGTETADSINGLEYLATVDIVARESAREVVVPFRPYLFWEEGVIRKKAGVKKLRQIVEKLMRLHREKSAKLEAQGVESRPFSILDFVALHSYDKEMSRLSDLTILAFAGIDTTAFTFCFLLMEMCKNPSVKTKLQAELVTFMPPRDSAAAAGNSGVSADASDKELLSAIAGCEYLTWCIKEVLRLWPVAAGGASRDLVEDIEYNGMLLPKDSLVICSFFVMFRERWIDQPDAYLPERWSDSNPQLPQLKEMLMPFSLGRRACLGQNMAMFQLRIVAAHFLHYFDFELAAEPTFEHFLTLKPDQLQMRVKERAL